MNRAEEFEKSLIDDKGNLVEVCNTTPAARIEYIEYKKFTFEDFKKAFEDLSSYEQEK